MCEGLWPACATRVRFVPQAAQYRQVATAAQLQAKAEADARRKAELEARSAAVKAQQVAKQREKATVSQRVCLAALVHAAVWSVEDVLWLGLLLCRKQRLAILLCCQWRCPMHWSLQALLQSLCPSFLPVSVSFAASSGDPPPPHRTLFWHTPKKKRVEKGEVAEPASVLRCHLQSRAHRRPLAGKGSRRDFGGRAALRRRRRACGCWRSLRLVRLILRHAAGGAGGVAVGLGLRD
jgi:hypothetical protein